MKITGKVNKQAITKEYKWPRKKKACLSHWHWNKKIKVLGKIWGNGHSHKQTSSGMLNYNEHRIYG